MEKYVEILHQTGVWNLAVGLDLIPTNVQSDMIMWSPGIT